MSSETKKSRILERTEMLFMSESSEDFFLPVHSPLLSATGKGKYPKEVYSAMGFTDPGFSKTAEAQLTFDGLVEHQSSIPRLPVPSLSETCEEFLKSIEPIAGTEEYYKCRQLVEEFQLPGGEGELLQNYLKTWDQTCGLPSWLEEYWDDAYLCSRDPIPINTNYFFAFRPHPAKEAMCQIGRASSLLYGAIQFHIKVKNMAIPREYEREDPVCMSQYRFLFSTARIPGRIRDRKICYTKIPLLPDEKQSHFSEYVEADPSHVIVMVRNRFFSLTVLEEDGTAISLEDIAISLSLICDIARSREEPGPPIGVFTTMDRTDWYHVRDHLKRIGNYEALLSIQSAIFCVALDSVEACTSQEAARLFLQGTGTNRWFDRHTLIVTRDGWAGVNWEHSVGDGTTTLRLADTMYEEDCAHLLNSAMIADSMKDGERCARCRQLFQELNWHTDEKVNILMKEAFSDYKTMMEMNETAVLRFRDFGGTELKHCNVSPDAFVQLAFQLTYYKMYGRCCATYEAASTRRFLHGRTECVRSATRAALDFCKTSSDPIFSKHQGSAIPSQCKLMQEALKAHTENMKRAKMGLGVDRHFYGLRIQAAKNGIRLPDLFTNPAFQRSARWLMSTSHCGSSSLSLFGFGPVTSDGYGIGYMIGSEAIDFVVTSKYSHPFTSSNTFSLALHASLLHMKALISSDDVRHRGAPRPLLFTHPSTFNDFQYDLEKGFIYKSEFKDSIRTIQRLSFSQFQIPDKEQGV